MANELTISEKVGAMEPEDRDAMLENLLKRAAADPSVMAFPPMMPVELAMGIGTAKEVCAAYQISREQFQMLIKHPVFVKAYKEAVDMLKIEGMSFRVKARLQAEDYLGTAFGMVKNPNISDAVRADLIKSTVRWAGYDKKAEDANAGTGFNIVINL